MQIDRTKFLALVATLGGVASACTVTTTNTTNGSNGDASTSGSSGGSSSGGADSGGSSGASSSGGSTSSGGGADSGASSGSSDASGDSASDAGGDAASDAAADSAGDGAACYGDLGTIPTCPTPPGGSSCSWEQTYCTGVVDSVLADVATAITTCIAGLTDCGTTTAYDCVRAGLNGACADSTADGPCSTIEGACAGTANPETLADCHSLVDGLNGSGRQKVLDCITPEAGTRCEFGLWSCIEGL